MKTKHKQQDPFFTRALVDAASVVDTDNEKSFEVVFATETPVFRRGWEENFNEVLSVVREHMRTARLDENAVPLLDNHSAYSVTNQMGRVDSYTVSGNVARAKIVFSTQEKFAGIWQDIKAGIIRSISVGYNVYKYLREVVSDNTVPNYRAIDWEVLEISLAPVPADYKSAIRSNTTTDAHEVEIEFSNPVQNNRSNMKTENTDVVNNTTETQTQERSTTVVTTPVTVDANKVAQDAAQAERTRANDIRTAVRAVKLDEAFADDLVTRGISIDEARTAIINKIAESDKTPNVRAASTNITTVVDEKDKQREAISGALMNRANPGSVKLEGLAQDYRFSSMLDIARQRLLEFGDKDANRYSPNEVIKRAISTTDYPTLLNSTIERAIRRTYDAITPEWQNIARRTTAKDFREKTGIAVDGKVTFEEIAEGGEYKNSLLLTDDSAKIKLKTYGRKITVTRQAIINDDLSVFEKLPSLIALGAANFQAATVWALLTGNAKTPDGVTMFHATHGNLAGAGAALSEATLNAARIAMYKQKSPAGEQISVLPKILLVPIELEMAAEKLMTAVLANATGDVNTFAKKYQIMTSPFLTNANAWYLAADPKAVEGLVYAFLEGEEGLFIDKEVSFDNDAIVTKARLDFAAAVWGAQGWYKNPGV